MKPVISNGIFIRNTSYEISTTNNKYGYPGGWDAMIKALSYTGPIGPIEYWKGNSMSKSREIDLVINILEYCKGNNITWKQLAIREGIHMRTMRGIMNTHRIDGVTTMRLLYGIGKVSTDRLIKYLTLCKKSRKYEKYIK